jgi:hypothetical protein
MAKIPAPAPELARIVVAPRDYSYAMARIFKIYSEKTRPNFQVVHTMDEAYRALGVVSPEFRPLDAE